APARIQLKRRRNRLRWAGRDATCASPTAVLFRSVGLQFHSGDDLGKEKPVAQLAVDQVGVLADKTESGPLRQITLQQRTGFYIPRRARFMTATMVDVSRQSLEPHREEAVVILKSGVSSDRAMQGECGKRRGPRAKG